MVAARILNLNAFSLMNVIQINHSSAQVHQVFVLDQNLSVLNLHLRAVEEPSHCVPMEIAAQIAKRAQTTSATPSQQQEILAHPKV